MTPAEVMKAADLLHKLYNRAEDLHGARRETNPDHLVWRLSWDDPTALAALREIAVAQHITKLDALKAELNALGITITDEQIDKEMAERAARSEKYRVDMEAKANAQAAPTITSPLQ